MKDSLAMYWVDAEKFESLGEMDFIEGGEVAMYLERKAHHIAEFLPEGHGAIGDVLAGLQTIMGAPFGDILGRNDAAVGPTGPHTFCGHIAPGTIELLTCSLADALKRISEDEGDGGNRLAQLESQLGHPGWFGQLLPALARFLRTARGVPGPVVCVYTRW